MDMSALRAAISSTFTLGWKRMPPLPGPRAVLCWMRQPWYISISPESMRMGTATSRIRLRGHDSLDQSLVQTEQMPGRLDERRDTQPRIEFVRGRLMSDA